MFHHYAIEKGVENSVRLVIVCVGSCDGSPVEAGDMMENRACFVLMKLWKCGVALKLEVFVHVV